MKLIGNIIGALIGTSISPCWPLLTYALARYFDLQKAMTGPVAMIGEFRRFIGFVEVYPNEVLYQLVPMLILILLISGLFVSACSQVGGYMFCLVTERANGTFLRKSHSVLLKGADAGEVVWSPWSFGGRSSA